MGFRFMVRVQGRGCWDLGIGFGLTVYGQDSGLRGLGVKGFKNLKDLGV